MAGPHAGNRNRPAYSGQPRFRFPKQIIELFAPRKPIEFKPPPRKRKLRPMLGVASYVDKFPEVARASQEQPARTPHQNTPPNDDPFKQKTVAFETPAQRRRRVQAEKRQKVAEIVEKAREAWDPRRDEVNKTKNAYTTLFVTNLPFETVEKRLQHELEQFGPVISIFMPKDRHGVPRGYAFVEFENESDMKLAYREANGMRIDGRRILVDVERGRTVEEWFPNRLNGPHNSCTRKKVDERVNRSRQ